MEWTVRYYKHMMEVWTARRNGCGDDMDRMSRGKRAYAEEKIAMWHELGEAAETSFRAAYLALPAIFEPA